MSVVKERTSPDNKLQEVMRSSPPLSPTPIAPLTQQARHVSRCHACMHQALVTARIAAQRGRRPFSIWLHDAIAPLQKLLDVRTELLGRRGRAVPRNNGTVPVDEELGEVPADASALAPYRTAQHIGYLQQPVRVKGGRADIPFDGGCSGDTARVLPLLRLQPRKHLVHVLSVHLGLRASALSDSATLIIEKLPSS